MGEVCLGQPTQADKRGTIVLHVMDAYGRPVMPKGIREVRITNSAGTVITTSSEESEIANLPYGDYKIRVEVPGFEYWNGDVHVRTTLTRVTVGMQLGAFEAPKPTCSLRGEVRGIDRDNPNKAWVRLLPSFAHEIFEADITSNGAFSVDGAECGKYVLAIISGKNILHLEPVELAAATKPLVVTLNPK
jgi:hypothetical protein